MEYIEVSDRNEILPAFEEDLNGVDVLGGHSDEALRHETDRSSLKLRQVRRRTILTHYLSFFPFDEVSTHAGQVFKRPIDELIGQLLVVGGQVLQLDLQPIIFQVIISLQLIAVVWKSGQGRVGGKNIPARGDLGGRVKGTEMNSYA